MSDMTKRKEVYDTEPFKIIEAALRAQGISKPLTDEFYASVIEMSAYVAAECQQARQLEHDWLFDKFGDTDISLRDFELIQNEAGSRLNSFESAPPTDSESGGEVAG